MSFHFISSKASGKVTDILKIFLLFCIMISYFDYIVKKKPPENIGRQI